MATVCSVCGGVLALQHETFDAIDEVYVGRLRCVDCDRTYLDQRKSTETRSGGPMAKRSKKSDTPKRPRQPDLIEDRAIKPLEVVAADYADLRDRRMELNKEEAELKTKVLGLMKKFNKTVYKRDGIEIRIVNGEEGVKVRVKKPGEEEPAGGGERVEVETAAAEG